MKNLSTAKTGEVNPIKLIWLITLLSFSVGVLMVYLVWSSLTVIRTERENLFELKENFISIQTRIQNSLAKHKSVVADLLESNTDNNNQEKDYLLVNLIQEYRRTVSDPDLIPDFEELDRNTTSLLSIKNKLTWWASAYSRTISRIPPARKKVESILYRILETVDRAEEQQRLDRAAIIREINQNIFSRFKTDKQSHN